MKITIILTILIISLKAAINDNLYTCIAIQKNYGNQAERLDMKQSLEKGGWFSFSVKINFLRAIISKNEDTINNIEYEDIRFAYRATVRKYDLYVYDYNKDSFLIEKDVKLKPHFSMRLKNGDRLYYKCMMYVVLNNTKKRMIK